MWLQQGPQIAIQLLNRVRDHNWELDKTMENGDAVFSSKTNPKVYMISVTTFLRSEPTNLKLKVFY